jgi:hypothetical protein
MGKWKTIEDSKVRHVWANEDGSGEITVDPTFYQDSGTPIDDETGDDLMYVRTEILEE